MDSDLFEPTNEMKKDSFLELYECAICQGVVIKPQESSNPACSTLFCERCINGLVRKECPKRCGSSNFHQANRLIMNILNVLRFKCLNQPECDQKIPYRDYFKHN